MSTFYSLLLFACLGVAASSRLEFGLEDGSDDGSETIAKGFLKSWEKLIAAKDQIKLAELFDEKFMWYACSAEYEKKGMLERLHEYSKVSFTFTLSKWIPQTGDITFAVEVDGFDIDSFEARFIIHKEAGKYIMIAGNVPYCPPRRSFTAPFAGNTLDSAIVKALKYYTRVFNRCVREKDLSLLAKKISDEFSFTSCTRNYDKASVLELVQNLPQNEELSLEFENSTQLTSRKWEVNVTLNAFHQKFSASLWIRDIQTTYQWTGGVTNKCP